MKNTRLFESLVAIFLLIGGLNWGLIGLFGWDVIASIFGEMTTFTRVIYSLIGFAAAYRVLVWLKVLK